MVWLLECACKKKAVTFKIKKQEKKAYFLVHLNLLYQKEYVKIISRFFVNYKLFFLFPLQYISFKSINPSQTTFFPKPVENRHFFFKKWPSGSQNYKGFLVLIALRAGKIILSKKKTWFHYT